MMTEQALADQTMCTSLCGTELKTYILSKALMALPLTTSSVSVCDTVPRKRPWTLSYLNLRRRHHTACCFCT